MNSGVSSNGKTTDHPLIPSEISQYFIPPLLDRHAEMEMIETPTATRVSSAKVSDDVQQDETNSGVSSDGEKMWARPRNGGWSFNGEKMDCPPGRFCGGDIKVVEMEKIEAPTAIREECSSAQWTCECRSVGPRGGNYSIVCGLCSDRFRYYCRKCITSREGNHFCKECVEDMDREDQRQRREDMEDPNDWKWDPYGGETLIYSPGRY